MKKIILRSAAVAVSAGVLVLVAACSSANGKSSAVGGTTGGTWAGKMQGMAKNLETLMPYVFSRAEFNDADNRKKIRGMIADFNKAVEVVPQHAGEDLLGKDPIVKFSLSRLKANSEHALRAYDEGHMEFARSVLRENMGLCFSCHTTNQLGPEQNFTVKAMPPKFRIFATEKADYYVATRQYEQAVEVLEGVIRDPVVTTDDPHEQVAALRKYLALQVRVKQEPARAASTIEAFLANPKLPYFIATDSEAWLKSLREWQREKTLKSEPLDRAKRLLSKAERLQSHGGYQSGYVDYLRASASLHEALRTNLKASDKAEVYQLLGQSYDTLSEMGTWDLPEVYFEACVREAPKTTVAKRCYKDYERAVILGFSGSAGIFIPKEERARLAELKGLAGF